MGLSELVVEVKELAELDTTTLTDDELSELMVELHRVRTMLEAHHARVAAAWDRRRVWAGDGAKTGAAWMARRCRAPKPDYGGLLWLAQRGHRFRHVFAAWETGEITRDHVSRLVRAWSPRVVGDYARDAALLVHHARTLTFDDFARALDYWLLHADPDGTTDSNEQRRHRRRGVARRDPLRHVVGSDAPRAHLGNRRRDRAAPVGATALRTRLGRRQEDAGPRPLCLPARPHGRTTPRRRPRRDGRTLRRRPTRRHCEAAVHRAAGQRDLQMVVRAHHRHRHHPHPTARVDRRCPPRSAPLRHPRRARHQGLTSTRVPRRHPPHHRSPRPPLLPPLLRHTSRTLPSDHITEWSKGGPTSQDNGRLACGHHNRLRNQRPPPLDGT